MKAISIIYVCALLNYKGYFETDKAEIILASYNCQQLT